MKNEMSMLVYKSHDHLKNSLLITNVTKNDVSELKHFGSRSQSKFYCFLDSADNVSKECQFIKIAGAGVVNIVKKYNIAFLIL
jgi:hypothetical protein